MTGPSPIQAQSKARTWLLALCVFVISCTMAGLWIANERTSAERAARLQASSLAANHARLIEAHLRHSLTAALTLATYVRNNTDQVFERFEPIARDMLEFYPDVSSLSLSPDGVVQSVVPLEGNRDVLGFNQLEDEVQGGETQLALESGELSVAGPLELVQGGVGIVARYPVFMDGEQGQQRFWGFTNVTLLLDNLLEVGQIDNLARQGYHYRLVRENPETLTEEVVVDSNQSAFKQPVEQIISVPSSPWTLELEPTDGWHSNSWLAAAIGLGGSFSLLLAYLVKTLMELRWHKRNLEAQVAERTRAVSASLERYHSLIVASNTGAWEYFHADNFLLCSPEYFSMLGRQLEHYDMSGSDNLDSTWLELIHPEDRQSAIETFNHYLDSGSRGMYENRFRMRHQDGHWVWILSRGQSLRNDQGSLRDITVGTHIDITRQVENEAKLELAAKVFERGSEGFIITDAEQRIVMVNRAFSRITGYSEEEALGQTPGILSSGRHDADFFEQMWRSIERDGSWQGEVWNRRKNGQVYPEWLSISAITNEQGQVTYYVGIISDISQLKEDQEAIHQLAYYDPLTKLPNRTLLEERAAFALKLAQRSGRSVALLFLDLDNFKNINDSLGHKAGDRLLIAFAQRLEAMVREEDTFARPGGDEFIFMLPNTDANGAAHAAQKILELLKRPFRIDSYDLSVSSSVGIALYPDDGEALNQLYTNADIAMYRSKQKGRNTYSFFTPELQSHYVRLMQLENAMRQALEEGQFELHYQPQQEIHSGAIVGLEALLRWHHPELGHISPAEFIPIAESSGLIVPIGQWVLREGAAQLRQWIDAGIAPPRLAINLSAAQFHQESLPDLILSILDEAQLPAEYLELELTESITMDDPERATTMINRLHSEGVSLSIDDFGTGYSSLSYLKRFKIGKLKIDQSFVRDLTEDNDDRVIVSTIITLAKSMGLRCIAEGVETREQLDFLHRLGCDDIQGYLYSRPLPAEEARAFLLAAASIG